MTNTVNKSAVIFTTIISLKELEVKTLPRGACGGLKPQTNKDELRVGAEALSSFLFAFQSSGLATFNFQPTKLYPYLRIIQSKIIEYRRLVNHSLLYR